MTTSEILPTQLFKVIAKMQSEMKIRRPKDKFPHNSRVILALHHSPDSPANPHFGTSLDPDDLLQNVGLRC
jgi:hypothetical protein